MTTDLEKELNDFKLAHYENADFDSLTYKIVHLYNKFEKLKDKKKQSRLVLDLYTLYLQAVEILFINSHALSVKVDRFPSALFIDSFKLRNFITDNFTKTTQCSSWFFKSIFSIIKDKNDPQEKYILYANLIKEVAGDYSDNFDLLNAYKHGYRVTAKHDKTTLSISVCQVPVLLTNLSKTRFAYSNLN